MISMQFHLNGFRSGDPRIADAAPQLAQADALPSEIDVLIVGSGPAGLTLATQLSAFSSISTAIIERKDGPIILGQADGIACRTMEMFQAFGFAEEIAREAYWVNETVFWKPSSGGDAIERGGRVQDVEDGLSEMPHVILNQARVHDRFLEAMRNGPARLAPYYSRQIVALDRASDDSTPYPITATIERMNEPHKGEIETIRARYVVGCDGARSTVRSLIGQTLEGDSANQAWGVMDVLAATDFPDIRYKAAIQSARDGSILIIPREGGYLTRIYVELDQLAENERITDRNITVEELIERSKRILAPFKLEVKEVAWWSCYVIGQRLCDKFDDAPENSTLDYHPRIFIAGDACHTHSPKAGQGMNVSMQDTFNLGWKIASVLSGTAQKAILTTYSSERQAIAKELIDFDREWAAMFSAQPKNSDDPNSDGIDPAEFQRYFVRQGRFTAGVETCYRRSLVCGDNRWQSLAHGFIVGKRFHSAHVVRLADAKKLHLGHEIIADGRWRLFLFAGADDDASEHTAMRKLCECLAEAPTSPIVRYTKKNADIDSLIDIRAIFQQHHTDLAIDNMPALLRPIKGCYGLHDYEKVFCAETIDGSDIYKLRGIDRNSGCMVLVRPDQYVAHVLPLDGVKELSAFLNGIMQ
jgi:phenol 2-monooxygenase (NADPH)